MSPVLPALHRIYDAMLARTLRAPRLAYGATGLILGAGILTYPLLGQELLPSFKERDFLMHWLGKPGTSLPEMVRISELACQELQTIPGVRNCGSHIGQALFMDEVYGVYFGENWISVDPSVDYDKTLASVQTLVDGYPGLFRDVQTYLKERIREVLTGSSEAVVVRIYGDDLDVLREKADELEGKIAGIDGIIDLHVEFLVDVPQIQVEVDLEKAQAYGLKPGDVRRAAAYLIAGQEAGDIHLSHRTYDVNIWTAPDSRANITDLQDLLIDTPRGEKVRLADITSIQMVPVPNAINHEGLTRRINVEANVSGRDLGSVVAEVEEAVDSVEFPLGYFPEMIGEYQERQAASQRILVAGMVAALVIPFPLARIARHMAAGMDGVSQFANGDGRRCVGGIFHRWCSLAWLFGWLSHYFGHCCSQWDYADQPLSASGRI